MAINTRRCYTADDIAALTALQAEANVLDAECRELMIEVSALYEARGANWIGWEAYAAEMYPDLLPILAALETDAHPFATANTSYIPQVGHLWNSRWNPTTWQQRNKRTARDIKGLRKALSAHKEYV